MMPNTVIQPDTMVNNNTFVAGLSRVWPNLITGLVTPMIIGLVLVFMQVPEASRTAAANAETLDQIITKLDVLATDQNTLLVKQDAIAEDVQELKNKTEKVAVIQHRLDEVEKRVKEIEGTRYKKENAGQDFALLRQELNEIRSMIIAAKAELKHRTPFMSETIERLARLDERLKQLETIVNHAQK